MRASLVRAEGLSCSFPVRRTFFGAKSELFAVRELDFAIRPGEVVAVVGESGCGKSTLGRLLLGLLRPTAGRVLFEETDLTALSGARLRRLRSRMQMIFQDPVGSLDPRRRVGAQIADGLVVHRLADAAEVGDRVAALMAQVGLDPLHASRLPHEFSGGQRQRIAIARALATKPQFVVADEPVAALDVSIQAQVVNLLADLRAELGLALLFISHDLHVVRHLSDRLLVMYLGRVVEEGPAQAVLRAPAHPYTRALLDATPSLARGRGKRSASLKGDLPSALSPPSGCVFRTRCPFAVEACARQLPRLESALAPGRSVACLRAGELAL